MKISDAGPLIILFKCDLLWILKELYETIVITEAVEKELAIKPE